MATCSASLGIRYLGSSYHSTQYGTKLRYRETKETSAYGSREMKAC